MAEIFGSYDDLGCGFPGSRKAQQEQKTDFTDIDIPEIIDGCAVPQNHKIGIENEDVEYSPKPEKNELTSLNDDADPEIKKMEEIDDWWEDA